MAIQKISAIELVKKLQSFNKDYFTMADLQKITDLPKESLKVALSRLAKKGVLTRIKRGIYQLESSSINIPKIANQLYYPSYLSFESALSRYGILSQVPYTQTFATTKKTKRMSLWGTDVEFRQLKKDLFFGYVMDNGMYVAEPEKALLDQLYMAGRGKGELNIKELDLKGINKKLFEKYAKRFPMPLSPLLPNL